MSALDPPPAVTLGDQLGQSWQYLGAAVAGLLAVLLRLLGGRRELREVRVKVHTLTTDVQAVKTQQAVLERSREDQNRRLERIEATVEKIHDLLLQRG